MERDYLFSVYNDLNSAPTGMCTLQTLRHLQRRMPAIMPWFRYFAPGVETDLPICRLESLDMKGRDQNLRSGVVTIRVTGEAVALRNIAEYFPYHWTDERRGMLFVFFEGSADQYPLFSLDVMTRIKWLGVKAHVMPWANNEIEFINTRSHA